MNYCPYCRQSIPSAAIQVNADTISDAYDVEHIETESGEVQTVRVIELKGQVVQIELPISVKERVTT